ncbi:MAG: hypothetical protein Fur0010_19970 [Bdellovibrio sp.]
MASGEKILLCGFMGCGKSTLLEKMKINDLEKDWKYDDLDELIYQNWASDFPDLGAWIETVGWERFRRVEGDILKEVLEDTQKRVIALGGGTVEHHERLLQDWFSRMFWIDVDFAVCWERIKKMTHRPLVKAGKNALEVLFEQRIEGYQKAKGHLNRIEAEQIDSVRYLVDRLE